MPKFIDRTGESALANNGMRMTIIACRGTHDIDVQFEDGTLVAHKSYGCFKHGAIGHPDVSVNTYRHTRFTDFTGETATASCGQQMTIIVYRSSADVDIQFEDGAVVQHKKMRDFRRGWIRHPDTSGLSNLGRVNVMHNGLQCEITAYRDSHDIDVTFADGVVVQHTDIGTFNRGYIKHPGINSVNQAAKTRYLGKEFLCTNGLKLHVIDYVDNKNITVMFETGYTCKARVHKQDVVDYISHPFPYQVGTIEMREPAYVYNNIGNFYCKCLSCGHKDIMTVEEMKLHKCSD